MEYNEQRGPKYPRWAVNEIISSGDLNAMASFTYQNMADTLATMVESFVGAENTGSKNVRVNGLMITIATDDLEIAPGAAVSFQGSYFDPVSGGFAFQADTSGQPFVVTVPATMTIADFVTSSVVANQEIRGNIEIRPVVVLYSEQQRAFVDPSTRVAANSAINTRGSFGAEVRLRYGNPAVTDSQAPAEEAGWVKIGELFIDNDGSQTIVDFDDWTSGAINFLNLPDEIGLDEEDLPTATTTAKGIVELATAGEVNDLSDTGRAVTPSRLPIASETQQGLVERASAAEVTSGTDTTRYVTPKNLKDATPDASDTAKGIIEIATQAEVDALSSTTRALTPGRLPTATTSQRGIVERATDAEVTTGTDTTRYVSPKQLSDAIPDAVAPPDATDSKKGLIEIATAAEANALADTSRAVTPGRIPEASTTQKGILALATNDEASQGSLTTKAVTPAGLAAAGTTGPTGPTGPRGPQGPRGFTGSRGSDGARGATGPQGPAGTRGSTGSTGPKGDKGDKGDTGPTGPTGPRGPQGPRGFTGSRGSDGARGATGPQGPAGTRGSTGSTGPKGDKGDKGDTGSRGPAGPTTQATTSARGAIEIATNSEATTGTDTGRAITPASLRVAGDARYALASSIQVIRHSGGTLSRTTYNTIRGDRSANTNVVAAGSWRNSRTGRSFSIFEIDILASSVRINGHSGSTSGNLTLGPNVTADPFLLIIGPDA